jgi:hypothetical protein
MNIDNEKLLFFPICSNDNNIDSNQQDTTIDKDDNNFIRNDNDSKFPPTDDHTADDTDKINSNEVTLSEDYDNDVRDFIEFVNQTDSQMTETSHHSNGERNDINISEIEDSVISDSTLKKYLPDLMHFLFWLLENAADCLTNHCVSLLNDYKKASSSDDIFPIINQSKMKFMIHLRSSNETPLMVLDNITPKLFMIYIAKLRNRRTGTFYGRSAYNQRRSALFHAFRLHNDTGFEPTFQKKMNNLFVGWFRLLSQKGRANRRGTKKNAPETRILSWNAEDPKLPLSVGAYKAIAGWLLSYGTSESITAHCFLVTTWNLACRSQNTCNIRLGDICWNTSFDSFTIKFAHSKTDQTGEESKYARHMFANPYDPSVCPVLAIAQHLSCNFNKVHLGSSTSLFPGNYQSDRFSKMLERCLESNKLKLKLEFGFDPSDIGSHSIRKGAATFLTSLPGGPSAAASCIRGGWTMGNVKDRYFRYSEAGDQFVGRCLALLNLLTIEFSCSPPMFVVEDNSDFDQWINDVVLTQYPFALDINGFALLCRMCTASLLFHRKWIMDHFSNSIIASCCHLYKYSNIKQFFEDHPNILKVFFPWNNPNGHSFSGIPPHAALLNDLKALRSGQERLMNTLKDTLKEALDETRTESAGLSKKELFTYLDLLKNDLLKQFTTMERQHCVQNDNAILENSKEMVTEQVEVQRNYNVHPFHGAIRRVPLTWRFPKCGLFHLWRQWWLGNDIENIPPLHLLVTKDIDFLDKIPLDKEEMIGRRSASRKRRPAGKTLSDMRFLIKVMKKMVEEEGAFQHRITVRSVDEMFKSIEERLMVHDRELQKTWRSVVRELRENKINFTKGVS